MNLKHSTAKKLKNSLVQTYGESSPSTKLANNLAIHTSELQQVSEIADNGLRATGLFPCDKNIFRPHDFPLASDDTDAAPVNHPPLVNTS